MNQVIDIPQEAPFTNCKLGREPYAKVLTDIVRTNGDGFVLAIDNKWGAGKTTFVSMWSQMLQNEEFQTLYFNAWENDFENNPFVAITAELKELLKNDSSETFKEVIKKGSKISKAIIPSVMKQIIKRYAGEEIADIMNDYSKGVLEAFQEDIDAYVDRKKNIKEFHNDLEAYIKQNSNGKPIVFIIDELDRCRPDYAVSVLENVKHLFSVKGIVFVLSIDKEQLGHAICGAYGSDKIDSNEYLRRFIDIEYSLPEPEIKNYIFYLMESCKLNDFFNIEERKNNHELKRDTSYFIEFSTFLIELKKPTLRQQQKIFQHVGIVLRSFSSRNFIIPELLVFLIYIKFFYKNIYTEIRRRELTHQQLLDRCAEVLNGVLIQQSSNKFRVVIESMMLLYYNEYIEHKERLSFNSNTINNSNFIIKSNFDNSENQEYFKKSIDQELNDFRRSRISIDYLLNKIDLLDPLQELLQ
ncbi:MAG: hypothetical protein KA734_06910 [Fluviicola sp.]|nr:hypothetical protein [Fluviicola sp.]